MSGRQHPSQPRSPGSLFRLPPELRAVIWKILIFDHPPRVCSVESYTDTSGTHPRLINPGNDPDGLFVYDYPLLRYICRESRQEAIHHSASLGWQVSGREHPKRRYQPDVDILYTGHGLSIFLVNSRRLMSQNILNAPIPMAVVQVREARHIATPLQMYEGYDIEFETLLRGCPRLDKVSSVLGNVSSEDTMDVEQHSFHPPLKLPKRPCTLGRIPSLEPIALDVSKAGMSAYMKRHLMKRYYTHAENASVGFAQKADDAARRLGCQSLPLPQPAMLLQLTSWGVDGEPEKWKEVKGGWP